MDIDLDFFETELLQSIHKQCMSGSNDLLIIKSILSTRGKIRENLVRGEYKTANESDIKNLLQNGLLRMVRPEIYQLTAKGAWFVETEFKRLSLDDLLLELDKKFWKDVSSPVSDRNKVILLSLFSTRAFSKDVSMSYTGTGGPHDDMFWSALEKSFHLLDKLNLIDTPLEKMYKTDGSKGKIANFLDNIDALNAPTFGVFIPKNRTYHLDVIDGRTGDADESRMCHILRLIFGDIRIANIEKILDFCIDVSRNEGIFFSKGKGFCSSKWDVIIEECINTVAGV